MTPRWVWENCRLVILEHWFQKYLCKACALLKTSNSGSIQSVFGRRSRQGKRSCLEFSHRIWKAHPSAISGSLRFHWRV
ncbi:UNVERIFIED_CONTAM: hypothetical protein FKN15_022674 [Acipenser sinensis]